MILSPVATVANATPGSVDGLLDSGTAHSNQRRYVLASQRSGYDSFQQPDAILQPVHQCGEEHAQG